MVTVMLVVAVVMVVVEVVGHRQVGWGNTQGGSEIYPGLRR